MFIPRQGLLITFVRATIPQTLHAAILFSCLCFYDFPKRTAPKIHKIWHLVNLINVRRPFAKKKRQKLVSAGNVFYVILTIQYAEHGCYICVLSFSVTIRIPRAVPPSQLGLSCHLVGLHPYPAHLLQPNKNIWHQPASQGILTIPDTDTEKSFELRKEEGWAITNSHHHPHHCVLI